MPSILVPTTGPESWRQLLADPEKHWRTGYSARALAACWEEARGFPAEVRRALDRADEADLHAAEMLIGVPERQVALPGGSRPSQTDLWVLARGGSGQLVSIAVEGKVSEPFGPTVGEWLVNASPGKLERLGFLRDRLGLPDPVPDDVRYQLFHRTASALIEAERFGASHAVLLVHSFSRSHEWLDDYRRFLALFGAEGDNDQVVRCPRPGPISLHAGWVTGASRYLGA